MSNPPSSHSEILQAYWDSNNNLSGTGDTPCSHHLSQQRPEALCHKRAIIISGDFLVRWHLVALLCSLPDGCSWWYQSPGCHQHVWDVVLLLPKGWEKPIWGWGMKGGEENNLALSIWCWGALTRAAQCSGVTQAGW